MATSLTLANATLLVVQIGLALYGHRYLALLAGLFLTFGCLAFGIVTRSPLNIALASVNLLIWLWFWWRSRKQRRPVAKEVGDESRQLRDSLVRKVRERRVTRRGLSPEPSR